MIQIDILKPPTSDVSQSITNTKLSSTSVTGFNSGENEAFLPIRQQLNRLPFSPKWLFFFSKEILSLLLEFKKFHI